MKKSIFTLAFLCTALAGMMLISCSKNNGNEDGDAPSYPEAPGLACVKINGIWWAPVNCGYDATNYPYGKLYQWGRKNGGGYNDGSTYTETIIQTATDGPVDASSENASKFYTTYSYDWLAPTNNARWNGGSETSPVKTEYDPCPEGWRVPTMSELISLSGDIEELGTTGWDSTKKGYWFNGTPSQSVGKGLFLPAAGARYGTSGNAFSRGSWGDYWSSSVLVYGYNAGNLCFTSNGAGMCDIGRAEGLSVRCVKE